MNYYFAPLEGISGYIFRNAHAQFFPGVDKYYAPFISTNQNHTFTSREMRDILPENQRTVVVPQLLSKVSGEFVGASRVLGGMGYDEVNLNLGCPSGTVVAKGKGSGMLANLEHLDRFLYEIFDGCKIRISVKTRVGIASAEEFDAILQVFNKYPVSLLIIHPRVQKDFYRNEVKLDAFKKALGETALPLCYNGDIVSRNRLSEIESKFDGIVGIMIGRGLVSNPALLIDTGASKDLIEAFTCKVYDSYKLAFHDDRNAMMRMKELWSYLIFLFGGSEAYAKKIKRAKSADDYEILAAGVFRDLELKNDPDLL